jgi:alpha-galactosidase
VWCSWYSFYRTITEPALHAVVDELHGFAFDVFQVDDGWQRGVGDWKPNGEFPSGMAALADQIRRAGYRPGLWLAPFLGHEQSDVVRDHPDWLLRDGDGRPVSAGWNWDGQVYALDVTHPAALEHILAVIGRAVAWGYDYLKLDFIYAGALPGVRYEPIDRHVGYRRTVERIRSVVGDDVMLVACGAPVTPSIGVFDAIRIGPDVSETWENAAATQYLHYVSGPQARYAVATSVPYVVAAPDWHRPRRRVLPHPLLPADQRAESAGGRSDACLPFSCDLRRPIDARPR